MAKIDELNEPIKPYLGDMIDDFRATGDWKINLTIKLTLIPIKDDGEDQPKHSESNNDKNMIGNSFYFAFEYVLNSSGTVSEG